MRRRNPDYNFVEPMILKILKKSGIFMSVLAINYHVNENIGRAVSLNAIKKNLTFLANRKKISEKTDKKTGVVYYKLIL
jgi:hypothetical protein